MQDYRLSDIYIYPIKSLGGLSLSDTKTTKKGLQYDRRWMLVDANHQFITIRNFPGLLFFDVALIDNGFSVTYRNKKIDIPRELDQGKKITCTIWGDQVTAVIADQAVNKWFSQVLSMDCSLVYMPETTKRNIKPLWGHTTVSLADGYPLLVTGIPSLKSLNATLESPVEMMRFRPNLVFEGGVAYDEFVWSSFKIGNTAFQGLKPCERCVVTTYDPITAEKGREPLLALSKRKINNKIVFGQHAKSMELGTIKIGDKINIMSHKSDPYDPIPGISS